MGFDYKILVAANVRRMRKAASLTQEQLAEKAGISSQHVSRIERGLASPTVETLSSLARGLDTDPASFFEKAPLEDFLYLYARLDIEDESES